MYFYWGHRPIIGLPNMYKDTSANIMHTYDTVLHDC